MVLLLLVLLMSAPVVAILAVRVARARRPATAPAEAVTAALSQGVIRRTTGWRWAGLIGGLAAGSAVAASGALGRGLLLAAPLFALCVLAGVVVGETSIQAPRGHTRIAAVEVRRVRDYLPRPLATAVLAAAALLLVLLTVTTMTGAADDLDRSGRVLVLQCSTNLRESAGPWPGAFYSVPLAAMVAVGLGTALAALRFVIRRPRAGADPAAVAADEILRQRAGRTVTGACGILVALPLAGCCFLTAVALQSLSCRPTWLTFAAWSTLALVPAALALISWCAVVLLSPTRGTSLELPRT